MRKWSSPDAESTSRSGTSPISPTIWQQDIADGSQFDSSDSKDSGPYLKKDSEHSMGDIKNILDQEDGKSGSKREEE